MSRAECRLTSACSRTNYSLILRFAADAGRYKAIQRVKDKQPVGRIFLELSAISAYGIWVIIFLFPLVLAGIIFLIDERRSPKSLILSSIPIGIIAASYILRFFLVRNTESLRLKVLQADNREQVLKILIGGIWWWLITLIGAIAAVISSRSLF